MQTYLDCIPCLVRQTFDVLNRGTLSDSAKDDCMRAALRMLSEADFHASPPAMAARIHRLLREHTGIRDPYRSAKAQMNWFALNLLPGARRQVQENPDPMGAAVRLAIAGNVIDLGVAGHMRPGEVTQSLHSAVDSPLTGDPAALAEAAASAQRILYLADNAGEIVFDQLLLELLPAEKIQIAVRGHPILNDATQADACSTRLSERWPVIDNGSDVPGTDLSTCSDSFRKAFEQADLVIAKGQGNYETLNDVDHPIFFLLKVKCPVIARDLKCEVGTLMLHAKTIG